MPKCPCRNSNSKNSWSQTERTLEAEREKRATEGHFTENIQIEPGKVIGNAAIQSNLNYKTLLAEANHVGYSSAGSTSTLNDLYRPGTKGALDLNQDGTILGPVDIRSSHRL